MHDAWLELRSENFIQHAGTRRVLSNRLQPFYGNL